MGSYFGYIPIFRGSENEQPLTEPSRYVIRLEPEAGVTLKLVSGRCHTSGDGGNAFTPRQTLREQSSTDRDSSGRWTPC